MKFLEIVQDASDDYDFEIYSFCLMNNHYHLLIKTKNLNLSSALQISFEQIIKSIFSK